MDLLTGVLGHRLLADAPLSLFTCMRMRDVLFDMHQDEKSTQIIRKIVPIFDLVFLNYFDVKLFAQVHSYDIRQ